MVIFSGCGAFVVSSGVKIKRVAFSKKHKNSGDSIEF
jgi:hypothetical protein